MPDPREAQIGIEPAQKETLAQKLRSVYCEQQAVINQLKAAQWNTQGKRAAELVQLLTAASPEQYQQQRTPTPQTQTIQPFPPSTEVAERISMLGKSVPSGFTEFIEYSSIEDNQAHEQEPHQNAEAIAKACERMAQTTRQAAKVAQEAKDPVTARILTKQLRAAETLATQLRRFS